MNSLLSKEDILALIREGRVASISDKGAIKFKEPGVEASSGAERVRRHRERKRNAETIGNDVTHVTGVTHVTPPPLSKEPASDAVPQTNSATTVTLPQNTHSFTIVLAKKIGSSLDVRMELETGERLGDLLTMDDGGERIQSLLASVGHVLNGDLYVEDLQGLKGTLRRDGKALIYLPKQPPT